MYNKNKKSLVLRWLMINYDFLLIRHWRVINKGPLHRSLGDRARSVSEISSHHYFPISANFDVIIWEGGLFRLPRSRFFQPGYRARLARQFVFNYASFVSSLTKRNAASDNMLKHGDQCPNFFDFREFEESPSGNRNGKPVDRPLNTSLKWPIEALISTLINAFSTTRRVELEIFFVDDVPMFGPMVA